MHWIGGRQAEYEAVTMSNGTYPVGSQWRTIRIPSCSTTTPSICGKELLPRPCLTCCAHYCDTWHFSLMDTVAVPADLKPGPYVHHCATHTTHHRTTATVQRRANARDRVRFAAPTTHPMVWAWRSSQNQEICPSAPRCKLIYNPVADMFATCVQVHSVVAVGRGDQPPGLAGMR